MPRTQYERNMFVRERCQREMVNMWYNVNNVPFTAEVIIIKDWFGLCTQDWQAVVDAVIAETTYNKNDLVDNPFDERNTMYIETKVIPLAQYRGKNYAHTNHVRKQ